QRQVLFRGVLTGRREIMLGRVLAGSREVEFGRIRFGAGRVGLRSGEQMQLPFNLPDLGRAAGHQVIVPAALDVHPENQLAEGLTAVEMQLFELSLLLLESTLPHLISPSLP